MLFVELLISYYKLTTNIIWMRNCYCSIVLRVPKIFQSENRFSLWSTSIESYLIHLLIE